MRKAIVIVKGFFSTSFVPKSVFIILLPAAMICVLGFIVGTSYAKVIAEQFELNNTVNNLVNDFERSGEWQSVRMRVTAYCPCRKCCGRYSDGKTACGHKILPGDTLVAADKEYPFGTEMLIAGYNDGKPVKVLDRGGAIRGNRLDVFFSSHKEALRWGVKYLDVKVRPN